MNSNKRCQEKYMLILHPGKRKRLSKKVTEQILVDKQQQEQQESFTIISMDESFFFYDSLVSMGLFGLNLIVRITDSQTFMHLWSSKH
jgi:hypothetical protein